ncbi:MAG: hypothetical protein QXG86_00350 [Candidatus Woesearchaeota archaeon]
MNKKALSTKIIAGFLIVIVAAIFYLTFISKVKEANEREIHKRQCKNSVLLYSLTTIKGYELRPYTIECPLLELTLTGNPEIPKQAEKMKKEIAITMAEAWDVFGRGNIDLFQESGTYCAVYALIDFKEKNKEIKDFNRYLLENNVPFENVDYVTYFTNGIAKQISGEVGEGVIDTSKKYAVVFIYQKKLSTIDEVKIFFSKLVTLGAEKNKLVGAISMGVISAAGTGIAVILAGGSFMLATGGAVVVGGLELLTSIFSGGNSDSIAMISFLPYENEETLKELGCQYLPISLRTR